MLILTKKNGLKIYLNLKTFEEEKLFYNKWYSMSDMPKYKDELLKTSTEQDLEINYRVEDIIDCKFEKKFFDKELNRQIERYVDSLLQNTLNTI